MLQLGPVQIDFTQFIAAAMTNPLAVAWLFFSKGGWLVLAVVIIRGFWWMWMHYITHKYAHHRKWMLLDIAVPAENIQTPKAVENIFAHLAGILSSGNLIEKYLEGKQQDYFSFELASIDGFVKFFVYTEEKYRDLVEASIYAQYPAAQIGEAEDYVADAVTHFPDEEWDLWGTEFVLEKESAYPIRTWEEFMDEGAEEAGFKDPMAAFLETMGSLRPGERLWLQIVITPIKGGSLDKESEEIVEELAGIPVEHKPSKFAKVLSMPGKVIDPVLEQMFPPGEEGGGPSKKDEPPSLMQHLTPGDREVILAVEDKAAKIGFKTKIRAIYLARKEIFHRPRAVYGLVGALKQVNTADKNALKSYAKVTPGGLYLFKERRYNTRKRKLILAYKGRSNHRGAPGYILNIEELATLWHFPVSESVKAPLLMKTESKRGSPPHGLPVEHPSSFKRKPPTHSAASPEHGGTEEAPPGNLPIA